MTAFWLELADTLRIPGGFIVLLFTMALVHVPGKRGPVPNKFKKTYVSWRRRILLFSVKRGTYFPVNEKGFSLIKYAMYFFIDRDGNLLLDPDEDLLLVREGFWR